MSKLVAILDIGSGKITVLVGFRGVNQTIGIVGIGEYGYGDGYDGFLDAKGFIDGSWTNIDALSFAFSKVIAKTEQITQERIDKLIVGVPAAFCTVLCNSVEHLLEKKRKVFQSDIEQLEMQGNSYSEYKADTIIGISPIFYKLDNNFTLEPIGRFATKINAKLSYTLCQTSFIEIVSKALKECHIENIEYCSTMLAQSLFLLDKEIREEGAILIDAGHLSTGVCVVKGEGIVSQFSLSIGSGHITFDLMSTFFVDNDIDKIWAFRQVEELKKNVVLSLAAEDTDFYTVTVDKNVHRFSVLQVNHIVSQRIQSMARTIENTLIKINAAIGLPIYLTGGLSYIKGVKNCIQRATGRPVSILLPTSPLHNRPDLSSAVSLLNMVLDE